MKYLILITIALFYCYSSVQTTPLDDYVHAPDPNYGYKLLQQYSMKGYTLYIYNFTSQKWLDETVSNRPIWWHYLCITIPDNVTKPDSGFLLIDGGSNTDGMPKPTDNFVELTSMFAVSTGTIGADLQQIPNQPIIFNKDPTQKQRSEDSIIAWTWKEFLANPDNPTILLRMPMTKASVRAMDAVTEIATQKNPAINIKSFLVAGASKRGWTTWAAVDNQRVKAAVPIVMDLLNMNENLHHHYKSLGGWTFAFGDYYELNVTANMDTPQITAMQRIIDPIYYLDRYLNTKLMLINTAGDEFFIPDDADYFWQNLLSATNGTAMVRRLPNAEHSCAGHEISIFFSMRSFFLTNYYNQRLPSMSWTRPNNATHGITIVTVNIGNGLPVPSDVKVYYAQTLDNKRRDFRLLVGSPADPNKPIPHPVVWKSVENTIQTTITNTSLIYKVAFPRPFAGWFGFFFQVSFPGPEDTVLQISSEVNIIPETFPFADCYQTSCRGQLV